ncbi:hypothetical protein J6590_019785 [Homalodisca vitripennis]|nr:hypothetical protein J6590_019785 [Homalodisca vitripennis]
MALVILLAAEHSTHTLLLSKPTHDCDPDIVITLGGKNILWTSISRGYKKWSTSTPNILSRMDMRGFWVEAQSGCIAVGRENVVTITSYKNPPGICSMLAVIVNILLRPALLGLWMEAQNGSVTVREKN